MHIYRMFRGKQGVQEMLQEMLQEMCKWPVGTQSRWLGLAAIVGACGREGSDIKRDRKVFYFIICLWGKKKLKWHLEHENFIFFITFVTPMSE